MRFVNAADYQLVDDGARAALAAIDAMKGKVTFSHEGCEAIGKIRTELLAFIGEARLIAENGGMPL